MLVMVVQWYTLRKSRNWFFVAVDFHNDSHILCMPIVLSLWLHCLFVCIQTHMVVDGAISA